ncbi:actin-histidine N-methyltransferase-like [Liolophura sinensis]|uniref:actin-histidine N-methyltransferase-like n=1 Tax=Liolophura sinensis TaxID=3198878 RepID=UPI0031581610
MGRKNRKPRGDAGGADNSGLNRAQKRELKDCIDKVLDLCTKPLSMGAKEWDDFIELRQVIERVEQLQTGSGTHSQNRAENIQAFLDWLNTHGVDTTNVGICEFKGYGYGLKAEKDFKTADLFLSIPRKLMLTLDSAKLSPLGPFMSDDKILQSMPNVALSLHLLCEKYRENSFWAPYINILPSSYNTPLYFSTDDLQLLKGSPTQGEAINQFRNITRQYAYFYRHLQTNPLAAKLPIKDIFTYDDYRWAVSTVMTRQNPIPSVDGGHMTYGLIPLWDMCNHQNGQLSTDFNLEQDRGECFCMKDFLTDQQIFIFYGARSNGEFFVHNGFVYKENEHDSLSIKLGISKNDPLFGLKSELLGRIGMLSSRNFSLHMGSEAVDTELLTFLRIFVMDEESLKTFQNKESPELLEVLGRAVSPLSPELELKAWDFLDTRASLLLKMYPTSLQEDEEMLNQDLSEAKTSAVLLRYLEKKLLMNAIKYTKEIKERLPLKQ